MLMSSDASQLDSLGERMTARVASIGLSPGHLELSRPSEADVRDTAPWTDDYSDLFGALLPR
jgi:hypothetical protein